jgi:hypothetical protein
VPEERKRIQKTAGDIESGVVSSAPLAIRFGLMLVQLQLCMAFT